MKKNLLIISFILILIVAVMGIGGTIYFYQENNKNLKDKSNVIYNDENATDFTFLKKIKLEDTNNYYEITINNKKLTFKKDGDYIYFNDKKVECLTGEFYITNKLIFMFNEAAQVAFKYNVFDIDGTEVKKQYENEYILADEIKLEDGKLGVSRVCNEKNGGCYDFGRKVGNLEIDITSDNENCKKLKDYPNVLNEYGNLILSIDNVDFNYSNYELSLDIENNFYKSTIRNVYSNSCVVEK